MTKLLKESQIALGAQIIKEGGTVAFRTETVYGLGADATSAAVQKIFDAKGRPSANPLIVHFASVGDIFAFFTDIDPATRRVLKKVKHALTVIVPRGERIPTIVSGGLDTVAVRVPSCRFARKFIKACGVPLAAPSANTSTRPSPTAWSAVSEDLDGKIDAIFMGRTTKIGVESTVVQVRDGKIAVLRLGGYNTKRLAKKTGMQVEIADKSESHASPGTQFRHYAPRCEFVAAKCAADMTMRIQQHIEVSKQVAKRVTVLAHARNRHKYKDAKTVSLGNNACQITKNLFRAIRAVERNSDIIICETFPQVPEFEAVNERISRAADGKII